MFQAISRFWMSEDLHADGIFPMMIPGDMFIILSLLIGSIVVIEVVQRIKRGRSVFF